MNSLRKLLRNIRITPTVILSSPWKHCTDTAEMLNASQLQPVSVLSALQPRSDSLSINDLLEEAHTTRLMIGDNDTVVVVGHEPHLSQLLMSCTGKRSRPLERLEAVLLESESVAALRAGQAVSKTRLPVQDFQEKELREKVRSKVAVTTFLSGFTLNAIVTLLRSGAPSGAVSNPLGLNISAYAIWASAITALFIALVLFVCAVYIYDRLAMPEGFWTSEPRPKFSRYWPDSFRRDFIRRGPVYAYMIRTWRFVFSPAVAFTVAGYFLLLALNAAWSVMFASAAAMVVGFYYYQRARPRLGVD